MHQLAINNNSHTVSSASQLELDARGAITSWSFPLVLFCLPIPLQLRIGNLLCPLLCLVCHRGVLGRLSDGDFHHLGFRLDILTLHIADNFCKVSVRDL